jgi:RND family efflux transporter MFP subunit
MKLLKQNFKVIAIAIILITTVAARLVSNKESFDRDQKLASETSVAVPVLTQKAMVKAIDKGFTADGTFVADKEVVLSSEISGKAIAVKAKVGDRVHTGQVLAELDHSVTEVQLQQAKANLQKLEKDLQRNESLIKTDGATAQQLEQSKQDVIDARATLVELQKQYDNSYIKAPFDGCITRREVENGSFLSPGAETFYLSTTWRIKLVVNITAEQLAFVQKGRAVSVKADDLPAENMEGTVNSINEKANQSKQFEVEISLNNTSDTQIKPGMFGKATFAGEGGQQALVIPQVAIPGSIKDAEVFVVKGDSAVVTKISVSPLNEKEVMVTSGLTEGDVLVVSGQINLTNGTKVKIIQ